MKRYEFPLYGFYDYTGMACHFEERAQQGWLLEKMGGLLWHYRKIEPRRLKFAVTYFPDVTGFEPGTPMGNSRMRDFCQQAGWILAADPGKFQVYYHEDPNAVELETEPQIQVETIHKTMKKNFLPSYYLLMLCGLLQICTQIPRLSPGYPFHEGLVDYLSGYGWIVLLAWTGLMGIYLFEVGRYHLWLRKARHRAEDGLMTPSPGSRGVQSFAILLLAAILAAMLSSDGSLAMSALGWMLVATVIPIVLSKLFKRFRMPAKWNRVATVGITMVLFFAVLWGSVSTALARREQDPERKTYEYDGRIDYYYQQDIPLKLADLGYETDQYVSHWREIQRSVLITRRFCISNPSSFQRELPDLMYVVADVHVPLLWDYCVRDLLPEDSMAVDPAPWGADQAWQALYTDWQTVVLVKGERLVYIQLPQFLTEEQMTVIGEKLFS